MATALRAILTILLVTVIVAGVLGAATYLLATALVSVLPG